MRKALSILLAALLALAILPAYGAPQEAEERAVASGSVELDFDGSDGYSGDYVVIYNPGTSSYTGVSTGSMAGLIETEIEGSKSAPLGPSDTDRPYVIDVDGRLAEEAKELPAPERDMQAQVSFNVGDTHTFSIYSTYSPVSSSSLQFKVLAKGEHCYIWTPTSTASNVYPLDSIDPSFAQRCADEFDSKFDLMQSSFGDHTNGSQGDGRLNMLYYNIDDGWQPGQGYVAGFFYAGDLSSNGMPILNIDTYPGVHYVRPNGEVYDRIEDTFNTMVHEYQHLIHYSNASSSVTWINECMSAAAEEICYPGSSVVSRIQSWINYFYSENGDWQDPPAEHEYVSSWQLHNGFSMYDWDNYLEMDDLLCLYAQVSLFAQYIYTQYGNTTFRQLLTKFGQGISFTSAFQQITGQNTAEFVKNFRVALTANTAPSVLEGVYGFIPQPGYDPAEYHDVENPYSLLAPVVFTGNNCSIYGGGAICVKPVDGVYYPPSGAGSSLQYVGVTLNAEPPEPVPLTGLTLDPAAATVYVGTSAVLTAVREPSNANNIEYEWISSAPQVASVTGTGRRVTVTGVSVGKAVVTCRAHDLIGDTWFTASSRITVKAAPTLDDALNVPGGTLHFASTGYAWEVDMDDTAPHLAARSTNVNVPSSTSSFTVTVNMNAGDTMTFDWKVSSESNYDMLTFYVNGTANGAAISGEVGWTTRSYTAPSTGSYTFMWEYKKDYSVSTGEDRGWVDNVFVPGYTADYLPGDIDMNGAVEAADALLALRYSMELQTLSDLQITIGDMNGDGLVTAEDALRILRIAMELD